MNPKFFIITVALLFTHSVNSASVYKCTKQDKTVIFTDKPCAAGMDAKVVYQETPEEIQHRILNDKIATIKQLIAVNQLETAKEYASKNNLLSVYDEQLIVYLNQKAEEEKQAAEIEKEKQIQIQQQTLAIQQQQLELQKQQIALEAEQQKQLNNQSYYAYPYISQPYPYVSQPINRLCQPYSNSPYCFQSAAPKANISVQISNGGLNPPPSSPAQSQMNPPHSSGSKMNPPPSTSLPINPNQNIFFLQKR